MVSLSESLDMIMAFDTTDNQHLIISTSYFSTSEKVYGANLSLPEIRGSRSADQ